MRTTITFLALIFSVSASVSAQDFGGAIYPNPATDVLKVPISKEVDVVEIRDHTGNQLISEVYLGGRDRQSPILFSLEGFPQGVYFVARYTKNGDSNVERLVILK